MKDNFIVPTLRVTAFKLRENRRVDKRSASTIEAQPGGCATLIHPSAIAFLKFNLMTWHAEAQSGGCAALIHPTAGAFLKLNLTAMTRRVRSINGSYFRQNPNNREDLEAFNLFFFVSFVLFVVNNLFGIS